jgi:hypothetical protein
VVDSASKSWASTMRQRLAFSPPTPVARAEEKARTIGFAAVAEIEGGHRLLQTLPTRHRLWAMAVARRLTMQSAESQDADLETLVRSAAQSGLKDRSGVRPSA